MTYDRPEIVRTQLIGEMICPPSTIVCLEIVEIPD